MSIDRFAAIAANFRETREALFIPEPEKLPVIHLPNQKSVPSAAFSPLLKMNSQKALEKELVAIRKKLTPFLSEMAPVVPSRPVLTLKDHFLWRREKGNDRSDGLVEALAGTGQWEELSLPHYSGPVGRAVTSYRTTFLCSPAKKMESIWLHFDGVDYRCEVYVNGLFAGNHEGFFEPFEFEIGNLLKRGKNTLLVRVFNDAPPLGLDSNICKDEENYDGDKLYAATGPGWDDAQLGWHHCPPGMGILAPITIERRPRIFLHDLFIRPLDDLKSVEVWVEVFSCEPKKTPVTLQWIMFGLNYQATLGNGEEKPSSLAMGKLNRYRFTITLPEIRIWSPEKPWMNELHVTLKNNGDTIARRFGMRVFTMDTENSPKGRLSLNHQTIRLFGANTMGFEQQDVMRRDFSQLIDDILLARIANLNFLRLTQRPVQKEIYDFCDRLGMMVQCDFPAFAKLPRHQFAESIRQCGTMERLVRNHPCVIITTFINEPFPVDMVDGTRQLERRELEQFFDAAASQVHLENPDRVIKPVDGDYDPPAPGICDIHCYNLWYNGHMVDYGRFHRGYWTRVKPQWYLGCGEYGIEGLDFEDLMRRRYPKEWLPESKEKEAVWSPGNIICSQSGLYSGMFFERPRTLTEWVRSSQEYQRWGVGDMTRTFRRDNRFVSFAVHLFIDAWPSGWMKTVMDCERHAKPAYFALKDALEPLRCDIRTDQTRFTAGMLMKFEFRIINSTHELPKKPMLHWQLKCAEKIIFAAQKLANIKEDESVFQGYFDFLSPHVTKRTVGKVELALFSEGKILTTETLELEFFPAMAELSSLNVIPLGEKSYKTCQQLGVNIVASGGCYLIDDFEAFNAHRKKIEKAAATGIPVIFHNLPKGEYLIGEKTIKVVETTMGPRHYLSRNPDHPLTKDFMSQDFRFWYSPQENYIVPLAENCFQCDSVTPLLTTVISGQSQKEWESAIVAGSFGAYRIMTLRLVDVAAANPIARIFTERMLRK